MHLIIRDSLKRYMKQQKMTDITVALIKKRSNCCALGVPKASFGAPKAKVAEQYDTYQSESCTLYIDRAIECYDDALTLDFSTLLGRKMIDVHGVKINRLI